MIIENKLFADSSASSETESNAIDDVDIFCDNSVYKVNIKNKVAGLVLLTNIKNEVITTAFFDPQYRGILDKLKYGNEGENRGKARCDLPQMNDSTIRKFIQHFDRTLKNRDIYFYR